MLTTPERVTGAFALIVMPPPRSTVPVKVSAPFLVWSPRMRSAVATTLLARLRAVVPSLLSVP